MSTVGVALLLASAAGAVDGVREINQTCALAGCFTGDSPGFPVEIGQPGSYRLTSNLDIRALPGPENITVVLVEADDVSIDLNGFAILGAATCSGTPAVCSGTGTGRGINAPQNAPVSNTSVRNGTIRGMGDNAIHLESPADGQGFRVEAIRAVSNGARAVRIISSQASSIVDCTLESNGTFGISAVGGGGGLIENNVVRANGSGGINAPGPFVVIANSVTENAFAGLNTTGGYVSNVFDGNTPDVASGVQLGANLCAGALCP